MSDEAAWLIACSGYLAFTNTLVGNPAPVVRAIGERMRSPRSGDLVLETTTFARQPWEPAALGRLVRVGREPFGDQGDTEDAWYVDPLIGGDTVRWTNASFIALPEKRVGTGDQGW